MYEKLLQSIGEMIYDKIKDVTTYILKNLQSPQILHHITNKTKLLKLAIKQPYSLLKESIYAVLTA